MYAELLEMKDSEPWSGMNEGVRDGFPEDLQTGWVAVAPIPVGKRCLAISHQGSGSIGVGE
jgi:snurportin-1